MRRMVCLGIGLALAACATPEWSKPGASEAEYQLDQRECYDLATGFAESPDYPSTAPYDYAYIGDAPTYYSQSGLITRYTNQCLERRGYVRVR